MRSKQRPHDYRYFPEPDWLPVHVSGRWRDRSEERAAELPERSAYDSLAVRA